MVADVAQQQAGGGLVDNDADIGAGPHRPEMRVLGAVELMEGQAGRGGVKLEVEGGGLCRLLLRPGQAGEGGGEGVGDAEVHGGTG